MAVAHDTQAVLDQITEAQMTFDWDRQHAALVAAHDEIQRLLDLTQRLRDDLPSSKRRGLVQKTKRQVFAVGFRVLRLVRPMDWLRRKEIDE